MKRRIRALTAVITGVVMLLFSFTLKAQSTNDSVEAIIQGRRLAQQILEQQPAESFTNNGVLKIRDDNGKISETPIRFEVVVTTTNWSSVYQAFFTNGTETLTVVHQASRPLQGLFDSPDVHPISPDGNPNNGGLMFPDKFTPIEPFDTYEYQSRPGENNLRTTWTHSNSFAGSDFSIGDLALEFFHWPVQKILKPYEMRRGRSCKVLESINPRPTPDGYSRVVSWIDNETHGIVQAYAYDAKGKLLKEFYPKDFKKVNGQWQMGEMEMINDQTGSETWIKFDLKKRN